MQKSRYVSLIVQSIYVVLTGLQLIFVPNMLLNMFDFGETYEVWIKVLGVVVLSLSIVYYTISKSGNQEVVKATVWSRLIVGVGFILLALSGQAKMTLILFAGFDIVTAVWTWMELKKVT